MMEKGGHTDRAHPVAVVDKAVSVHVEAVGVFSLTLMLLESNLVQSMWTVDLP